MEIDFRLFIQWMNREFGNFSKPFKLTLALILSVVVLFAISPEDPNHSFPVLNGSRFMWTMAIPIISSICVVARG